MDILIMLVHGSTVLENTIMIMYFKILPRGQIHIKGEIIEIKVAKMWISSKKKNKQTDKTTTKKQQI